MGGYLAQGANLIPGMGTLAPAVGAVGGGLLQGAGGAASGAASLALTGFHRAMRSGGQMGAFGPLSGYMEQTAGRKGSESWERTQGGFGAARKGLLSVVSAPLALLPALGGTEESIPGQEPAAPEAPAAALEIAGLDEAVAAGLSRVQPALDQAIAAALA